LIADDSHFSFVLIELLLGEMVAGCSKTVWEKVSFCNVELLTRRSVWNELESITKLGLLRVMIIVGSAVKFVYLTLMN
jgi:hypothetical protein